jgi:hypothetical protein
LTPVKTFADHERQTDIFEHLMDEIGDHAGVPQIEPPRNRATLSAGTRLPAAALTSVNLADQMRQTGG